MVPAGVLKVLHKRDLGSELSPKRRVKRANRNQLVQHMRPLTFSSHLVWESTDSSFNPILWPLVGYTAYFHFPWLGSLSSCECKASFARKELGAHLEGKQ